MRNADGWQAILAAPFGRLGVRVADGVVTRIGFLAPDGPLQAAEAAAAAAVGRLEQALAAYWLDSRAGFAGVPVRAQGTDYQQRVWQAIATIGPGQTRTYGELAARLGSSPRALGQACGSNPLPLVVPCHRVGSRSGMGGFMHSRGDEALGYKNWLLAHERSCEHPFA